MAPRTNLPARFIFATENGTSSGWNNQLGDPSHSVLGVDNSASGAVYKGLAIAINANGTSLYAANFSAGTVEMYNSSFGLVKSFTDPSPPPLPPGTQSGQNWAPFNVQLLNGQLYVSYALQAPGRHDDQRGAGNGFVDIFNTDGTFVERLINTGSGDPLNSPWDSTSRPPVLAALPTTCW